MRKESIRKMKGVRDRESGYEEKVSDKEREDKKWGYEEPERERIRKMKGLELRKGDNDRG